ncbi:MAG TPA: SRPBCC domain-containing protein [Candidatus Limnocylindrales bacterium]|nr:SRPBCC domain-containing protein [Candidatus Limnocylindrales bacterium]
MDDEVFRALADPSRRTLLDRLFERDGQTLGELEAALPGMTRFGVMKHLRVLEAANLVTSRKVGRERHHYLNPVPIRGIHDRWLDRFAIRAADLLTDLKTLLEIDPMTSPEPATTGTAAATDNPAAPRHVFATFIRATPEAIWRALTDSDFTTRYWYGSTVHSEWTAGAPWELRTAQGRAGIAGEVLESDPPHRLVMTYRQVWGGGDEAPSRVTFEIAEAGPGVQKLTLVHETEPGSSTQIADVAAGWPYILAGLKTLLETGQPMSPTP